MVGPSPHPRCSKCLIGFPDFGDRTGSSRYIEHMELRHTSRCDKCELRFISAPHLKYHNETLHDTPCDICGLICELECVETCSPIKNFSDHTQHQAKYIDKLEKDLILEGIRKGISDVDLKKKLQGAVIKLDIGVNDENLDEL